MFLDNLDLKKEYIFIGFKELKSYFIKKKSSKPQLNFKYYSLEELQESVFGSSNLETIKESLPYLDFDFKLTKKFVSYIKKGVNEEIDSRIKNLKENLIRKNLLTLDLNFKQIFKNKTVIIFGYSKNNVELNHCLELLNVEDKIYISLNEIFSKKEFFVTKFLRNDEEIRYAFIKINKLLEEGVSPLDIKIITDIKTNYFYLKLYEKQFGLVLNLKEFKTLYDTKVSKAIERSSETLTKENIDSFDDKSDFFKDIKDILEYFDFYNLKNKKENYKNILRSYSINEHLDIESIEVTSSLNYEENKHIFIIGFDSLFYSQVNKNNDYFDDELKTKNNLNSTMIENIEGDALYENFLNLNDNFHIYFHESDGSKKEISFYFKKRYSKDEQKSHLLNPEVLDEEYSRPLAKAYYSYFKDLKFKYFKNTEYYDLYHNYFGKLDKFDSSFKGISRNDNSEVFISYTPMNAFYECPFKYYCSYVLELDDFKENFSILAGNLLHSVFEEIYTSNESFDEIYCRIFPSFKDKFNHVELWILEKMKKIGRYIFNDLRKQKEDSKITDTFSEAKLYSKLKNLNALVYGKVDSILLAKDDDKIYAQILDYKTGSVNLTPEKFEYGINLQLPLYKYALTNSNDIRFKDVEVSGVYYVNFYAKDYANFYEDDFEEEYSHYLKEGLTTGDLNSVLCFEPKFIENKKSKTIKSLKTNGKILDGKSADKVNFDEPLIDEKGNEFSSMINQILENFLTLYRENRFDISPQKWDENFGSACHYCGFKDICFENQDKIRNREPLIKIKGLIDETKEEK